ncbi:MAG: serine protease [Acidimicrobiales bacterium]
MHREWSSQRETQLPPERGLASTSWNERRLVASAVVVAVALLLIGVGVSRLLHPGLVAAGDVSALDISAGDSAADDLAPATEVGAAVEEAPATELGDAVASRRGGPFVPAPAEHLTVVHVSVSVCDARSSGSGVVVADGLLLTAAHVVGDAALVRIDQGGITVTGEVLGVLGDERDLALVAVDAPMRAPLAAAPAPALGAPVTLVGFPDGGPRTVSVGPRVDVTENVARLAGGGEIVGVDVGIEAGISGGPAIDETGTMVGIVVAKEAASDTALVVATPDLVDIGDAALVPGTCVGSA